MRSSEAFGGIQLNYIYIMQPPRTHFLMSSHFYFVGWKLIGSVIEVGPSGQDDRTNVNIP